MTAKEKRDWLIATCWFVIGLALIMVLVFHDTF